MPFRPTPWTAALAGLIAALAWPWVWTRYGGVGTDGSTELVMGTLLVVAVPAHALVVGWGRAAAAPAGGVDRALLQRMGAWLAAAAAVTGLRALMGW
jgi:hypothetical protein